MRSKTALRIYVSLFLAGTAFGDFNWKETHDQGVRAFRDNQLEIAEPFLRRSFEQAHYADEIATSGNDLGVLLHYRCRDAEAKPVLTLALAEWQRLGRKDAAARSSHALGAVLRSLGEYAETERILRLAIETQPTLPNDFALLTNAMADLLREEGRLTEAANYAHMTLQTPGLAWRTSIDATITLADVHREARLFTLRQEGWTKAISESRLHNDSVIEAVALRGLAETQLMIGDRASAEPTLRKALAYFESTGNKHQIASTLTCLADLYLAENKPALSEQALRRAVELDETVLGPMHPQIAVMLQARASAAAHLGAMARARADLDRAGEILKARFGNTAPVLGAFFANRGMIEERGGNPADAAANYAKASGILRAAGDDALHLRTIVMEHYAGVLRTLHKRDQAKAALAEAKSFKAIEAKGFRP